MAIREADTVRLYRLRLYLHCLKGMNPALYKREDNAIQEKRSLTVLWDMNDTQ
jgi:hypothetical protein